MKIILTVAIVFGFSIQAFARDHKNDRANQPGGINDRNLECHWLGTPTQDYPCEGKQFTKGFAQCGPWVKIAYCQTRYAGDVNHCLYNDNDGDTRECYTRSSNPITEQGRRVARGTAVRPACQWSELMFTGYQDPVVTCYNEEYLLRRASCSFRDTTVSALIFCHNNESAITPNSCMADEVSGTTLACRRAYMRDTGRVQSTGERSTGGSVQ